MQAGRLLSSALRTSRPSHRCLAASAARAARPAFKAADALSPAIVAGAAAGLGGALLLSLRGNPALEKRVSDLEVEAAGNTSAAFVFIKPHAVTDKVKALVKAKLEKEGITVISEGTIKAETIDKKMLIDTHYGAIASKAVKQKPSELTVQPKAQDAFKKAFGISWADALKQGKVYNAMDAAAKMGCTTDELGSKWEKLKKDVDLLKFGGGFYCGKVGDIFVINAFYMSMRSKFTKPGTSIYYFETEFPSATLSWGDFRGKVLGGTDPKTAEAGSLRNTIYKDWTSLGLSEIPNTGDNGVHASASPFEALSERSNWLGASLSADPFGKAMIAVGVPLKTIKCWTDDPPVPFEGKKQSLFDLLEDLDGKECLKKSAAIYKAGK